MDFFYDGGTKVFTPLGKSIENLAAVKRFLKNNDSIDFILIQEIDRKSKRSYKINQFDTLCKLMNDYNPFFAKNYDVFFVPRTSGFTDGKSSFGDRNFQQVSAFFIIKVFISW